MTAAAKPASLSTCAYCGAYDHDANDHESAWREEVEEARRINDAAAAEEGPLCAYCGSDRHSSASHEEWQHAAWKEEVDRLRLEGDMAAANDDGSPSATGAPRVRVNQSARLMQMADVTVAALRNDAGIFQRGDYLVHVTHVTKEEALISAEVKPGYREEVEGTPRIHIMASATLRERLTEVIDYRKFNIRRRTWEEAIPPDHLVDAVAARRQWAGVPRIVSIAEAPFMRRDGDIIQRPGHDPDTGFLYTPTIKFPTIASAPSRGEVDSARCLIEDIFADFPFESKEHAAVPVAAMMTILLRAIIHGSTPMICADANTRGAGKSLMTDVIAYALTGRAMPRKAYPRNEEELEKVLGGYALRGGPFFSLDNVNRELGGGALDATLTAPDTVELRILGRSEIPTLQWRALIFATGNNLQFYGDTSDRVLLTRIESPLENPRSRTGFRHSDLRGYVRDNRGRIIAALLTMARAWHVAGRPQGAPVWGSFEAWSAIVPQVLVYAGFADPMGARITDEMSVNDDLRNLAAILEGLPRLLTLVNERCLRAKRSKKEGLTAQEIIEALYADWCPASFIVMRTAAEGLCNPRKAAGDSTPTPTALTRHLRTFRGRVLGGRRLRDFPDPHTKVLSWWSEITRVNSVGGGTSAGVAGLAGHFGLGPHKLASQPLHDQEGEHAAHRGPAENGSARPATPATVETGVRRKVPPPPEGETG